MHMTHERQTGLNGEAPGGPEHDHRLPDARDVPEYSEVEQSMYSVDAIDLTPAFGPPMEYCELIDYWLSRGRFTDA